MLVLVRMASVARLAAALVAVTLSGAPRVLALHAPVEGHCCACRAHGGDNHECECAICRKAALAAQASDEKAPPCHRAAARKALSERAPTGSRSVPCIEGTCGGSNQPTMTPAGVEPFCLPAATRAVALADRTESRPRLADAARKRPFAPETPPPRAA
jgi:hypothetical protein